MKYPLFVEHSHTSNYKIYRPTYPPSLYQHILKYYFQTSTPQEGSKIPLCLDVACGNGQATCDLADQYCERVIGVDGSKNQIEHAQQRENVEYQCHNAEDLSFLPENSVNLITVATALHWFNLEAFFKQVDRVLKKDGVLAVWTYGVNLFETEEATRVIQEFDTIDLKGYWSEKRLLVDTFYAPELHVFPYANTREQHVVNIEKVMSIREYVKFIETVCFDMKLCFLFLNPCFL